MLVSSATLTLALRVLPNAVTVAFSKDSWHARWKNSMSLGLEPGQPPSIYADAQTIQLLRDQHLVAC